MILRNASELKRPTSKGLDTGAPMFSQSEVDRILSDSSVKRFMCFTKQVTKGGAGSDNGKEYQGQWYDVQRFLK